MSKKSATFNQVDNSKSEADSDHTKYLVEPQQNHANRLQLRGQLTNYGILQKALKTDQAWKTSKLS